MPFQTSQHFGIEHSHISNYKAPVILRASLVQPERQFVCEFGRVLILKK
jgi:hypothetical protein